MFLEANATHEMFFPENGSARKKLRNGRVDSVAAISTPTFSNSLLPCCYSGSQSAVIAAKCSLGKHRDALTQ